MLLSGLPPLPVEPFPRELLQGELWKTLQQRFLLPAANKIHMYLFPGTVRHLHPEFDAALGVLLRTDPLALVVVAVPKSGRDQLPPTHPAVRHDLTHPTMPAAAVSKLRQRLRAQLGPELAARVRFLPPLDAVLYRALRRAVVAVLDPFPVGMHLQVLEALQDGVPVVSAPMLQECASSHTPGLAVGLGIPFAVQQLQQGRAGQQQQQQQGGGGGEVLPLMSGSATPWPTTPEEYAVLALRLHRELALHRSFMPAPIPAPIPNPATASSSSASPNSHGDQIVNFLLTLTMN